MPGFLFGSLKWVPPPPHTQESAAPPPLWVQGGETAAYGEVAWNGGPNSGDRTDTLVVLYCTLIPTLYINNFPEAKSKVPDWGIKSTLA